MKDPNLSHASEITDLEVRTHTLYNLADSLRLSRIADEILYIGLLTVNYVRKLHPDPLMRTGFETSVVNDLLAEQAKVALAIPVLAVKRREARSPVSLNGELPQTE